MSNNRTISNFNIACKLMIIVSCNTGRLQEVKIDDQPSVIMFKLSCIYVNIPGVSKKSNGVIKLTFN